MDSFYLDEPPSYAESHSTHTPSPSPTYSPTPNRSEVIISSSLKNSHTSQQDYVYRSKRFTVNLGPKAWGTNIPAYGYRGSVGGTISLSGDVRSISSVTVKLEGAVTSSYAERGYETKTNSVALLSTSTTYTIPESGDWTQDKTFSLTFPTTSYGKKSALPPSSALYLLGRACKITYRLKVIVVRKGLRRNDILKIPLLYLPRTFAKARSIEYSSDFVSPHGLDETKVISLRAIAMDVSSKTFSITLSLSSVLSFSAQDTIPLQLMAFHSYDNTPTHFILSNAKIQLIKRTWTCVHGIGRSGSKLDSVVGVAELVGTSETPESLVTASYELRTDQAALQNSWSVEGIVEQQYFIQATVPLPPENLGHTPSYFCEQPIELTSDAYDSPGREIEALNGYSRPYLGALVSSL